jgi:sortase A
LLGLPIKITHPSLPVLVRSASAESYLLLIGIGLLGFYVGAHLHSLLFSRIALEEFRAAQAARAADSVWSGAEENVDFSRWAKPRIKAYRSALALKDEPPIAVLNIHSIGLRAPVFDGTDHVTLNRGLGRIPGTAEPGGDGNVAIAGHRDGFFRALKDIKVGDTIEVDTRLETDTYLVDFKKIVGPGDVSVLKDHTVPTVTLVTCYPFYFIGEAPRRFIVRASLQHRDLFEP